MKDKLTLDWIINTLKKSGCNSKQVVIDRLENCEYEELVDLSTDLRLQAGKRCVIESEKEEVK